MKVFKRIIVLVITTITIMPSFAQENNDEDVRKLVSALKIINYAYVEDVDAEKITEEAIKSMLRELDPHSTYLSKEELKKANEPLEGNFEGVGIQFQIYQDTILVVAPIPGGPSYEAGILAGDKIINIDGEKATGKDIDNKFVQDHLRGKKGTEVEVDIKRADRKDIIQYTIVRDEIPLNSVDAGYMLDEETGLIKVSRFSRTTVDEFDEYMKDLKKQGMQNLILDLRGNPGGYLQTAIDLADQFLDDGKTIVYTEGRVAPRRDFDATEQGSFQNGKLIVLINEGSASASEIVSGAVQDYGRGLVVGRRSFGKGLVQRPFNLPDSSVIRLTTARYHTPSGRCIQRPYADGADKYYDDLKERMEHQEHIHVDSISFPDSLKYETTTGKTVYGGGGIMPDIFVAWDSTAYTDYYTELIRKQVPNNFVINYLEDNRKKLEKEYKSVKDYKNKFQLTEDFMLDFREYAEEKGVEFDEEGYSKATEPIQALLKAHIARNIFDIGAYYEVISEIDRTISKSLKLVNDENVFTENKIAW
ncbi:MAG: S41 family peptidase [Bacteroidota bacterium]